MRTRTPPRPARADASGPVPNTFPPTPHIDPLAQIVDFLFRAAGGMRLIETVLPPHFAAELRGIAAHTASYGPE